jgi:hypothetical protein
MAMDNLFFIDDFSSYKPPFSLRIIQPATFDYQVILIVGNISHIIRLYQIIFQ